MDILEHIHDICKLHVNIHIVPRKKKEDELKDWLLEMEWLYTASIKFEGYDFKAVVKAANKEEASEKIKAIHPAAIKIEIIDRIYKIYL